MNSHTALKLKAEWAELYKDGFTTREIGQRYGISEDVVQWWFKKISIPLRTCPRLDQEDDAEIRRRYEAGESAPKLARAFNKDRQTILKAVRRAGGKARTAHEARPLSKGFNRGIWRDKDLTARIDQTIRDRYPQEGGAQIASEFGTTKNTISMRAWRLGVKSLTHYQRKGATRSARSTSVNQAYFETWSPNMAYILGYIWADGCVYINDRHAKLIFRCVETDRELLAAIKEEVKATTAWQYYKGCPVKVNGYDRYQGKPQVAFSVHCRRLVKCLIEQHGILPNKSNRNPSAPMVPSDMMPHFARGVLDGDGSVVLDGRYRPNVIYVGTHVFISDLRNSIVACAGIRKPSVLKCGSSEKLSRIGWSAKCDLLVLIPWLYPSGNYIFLQRKRNTANEILGLLPSIKGRATL